MAITTTAAVLIVLAAGLFVGSRFESARDAHEHFSSYRTRTAKVFRTWLTNTMVTVLGVAALALVLYLILYEFRVH